MWINKIWKEKCCKIKTVWLFMHRILKMHWTNVTVNLTFDKNNHSFKTSSYGAIIFLFWIRSVCSSLIYPWMSTWERNSLDCFHFVSLLFLVPFFSFLCFFLRRHLSHIILSIRQIMLFYAEHKNVINVKIV